MASCDLIGSCFFFNEQLIDMTHTTEYLKEKYCKRDYDSCARYGIAKLYGQDKVPKYLFPNDMFEYLNFDLPETSNSQKGTDMQIEVIQTDGTFGWVKSSTLGKLVKMGGIAAYQCSEGWIEVRRKQSVGFGGPERRASRAY
jgi:hypothetical protein